MNYELATKEQLLSIISGDADCPTHLLCGVVHEMMQRDMFHNLIYKAIVKRFSHLSLACKKLCISDEELFQTLNMEIWERLPKFIPGKAPFGYYAYLALRGKIGEMEKAFNFGRKKILLHLSSMEIKVGENARLEDCLPSKVNVERMVINKITFEERLQVLSEGEKQVFLLYLKGYSFAEISSIIQLSKSGVNKRMRQTFYKLTGKKINLKELGINQYKVGA